MQNLTFDIINIYRILWLGSLFDRLFDMDLRFL